MHADQSFVIKYIPSTVMHADALTKPLQSNNHYRHIKKFGVVNLTNSNQNDYQTPPRLNNQAISSTGYYCRYHQ